jgi:TatD DNase family protein
MFVDAHAHIDRGFFKDDLDDVIRRFRAAGVHAVVTVGSGSAPGEMEAAVEVARANPDVVAVVGCHPHAGDDLDDDFLARIERLAADSKVRGIGETGLDFHYDLSSRAGQIRAFEAQLDLARRLDLPVVIHCREAFAECLGIVRSAGLGPNPGQIHCFTGNSGEVRQWLDLGFMVSIPGVVTFRNTAALAEAVRLVPDDALLIETDSPYLAPVPLRGRTNEPAFIVHTAAAVAAIRGVPVERVAEVTSANAARLFKF